jgi:hypothetical protein
MSIPRLFIGLLMWLGLTSALSASPNIVDLKQAGQMYMPAQQITELDYSYANSARESGQDSHIEIRFDVDEQGQPFNFHFARTSGTAVFEKYLTLNLQNWQLQPATVDGKPVVQRNRTSAVTYYLKQRNGRDLAPQMRRQFQGFYRGIRDLFKEGKYEEFEVLLGVLEQANIANFTENRQLYLLKNAYLNKTDGLIYDKIYSLEKALKGRPRDEKGEVLEVKVMARLFALYAQNNQLNQARILYYQIANSEHGKQLAIDLGPQLDLIESKIVSGEPLQTKAMVFDTELLNHWLSRNSFSIEANADILYAELECDEFNLSFDYVPEAVYQTPLEWGFCVLSLQAPKNTIVTVTES